MVSHSELRNLAQQFATKSGYEVIPPASLLNKVTDQMFNFSMEEPILRKYGSYMHISEPYSYHAIQPCIRMADFTKLKQGKNSRYHSTLFHMSGFCRFHPEEQSLHALQQKTLEELWDLFVHVLHLNPKRISVSYFSGGPVRPLVQEHMENDFVFPEDRETKEFFHNQGLEPHQLQAVYDTDRLLITFPLPGEFYAGLRPEIFYQGPDGQPFEIGTIEFIQWKRVLSETGLSVEPLGACGSLFVFGVERMLAAINQLEDSFFIDSIRPLSDEIAKRAHTPNLKLIRQLTDAVRTLHFIVSDRVVHESLPSQHLKADYRIILKLITKNTSILEINEKYFEDFFKINAQINPWKQELDSSIPVAIQEIQKYLKRQEKSF